MRSIRTDFCAGTATISVTAAESGLGGDHTRANPPLHRTSAEALDQSVRCPHRGLLQAGWVARVDLVAQGRPLTVGDGDLTGRRRPAGRADSLDGDVAE